MTLRLLPFELVSPYECVLIKCRCARTALAIVHPTSFRAPFLSLEVVVTVVHCYRRPHSIMIGPAESDLGAERLRRRRHQFPDCVEHGTKLAIVFPLERV